MPNDKLFFLCLSSVDSRNVIYENGTIHRFILYIDFSFKMSNENQWKSRPLGANRARATTTK